MAFQFENKFKSDVVEKLKLARSEEIKILQPIETGTISAIFIKEGMKVKIGMYEKNIVFATVTAIMEDKIIAHCSYFQKSYYLHFTSFLAADSLPDRKIQTHPNVLLSRKLPVRPKKCSRN